MRSDLSTQSFTDSAPPHPRPQGDCLLSLHTRGYSFVTLLWCGQHVVQNDKHLSFSPNQLGQIPAWELWFFIFVSQVLQQRAGYAGKVVHQGQDPLNGISSFMCLPYRSCKQEFLSHLELTHFCLVSMICQEQSHFLYILFHLTPFFKTCKPLKMDRRGT